MTKRPVDDLEDLSRRAGRNQNQADPTRAKPPPWFVGASPRLMVAVLALIALLIVLRLLSTFWLVESAWWSHWPISRPNISFPATIGRQDVAGSARLPVPRVDMTKAGASLRGNPGRWFRSDAYPADAIRAGEQGRTVARLGIDPSGTPVSCAIETTSGSRSLDAATCSIALRRVTFEPARDAKGRPIPSRFTLPVRWVLPTG